jgi:hypothetical protein
MTLTAAGISQGFTLSTFADGFPNSNNIGPVGIGFASNGAIVISDFTAGKNAVFATDTDGQHYSGAALSSTFLTGPTGISNSGGILYQAQQSSGEVDRIDNTGNFVQQIVTGLQSVAPGATGMATNPNNGHLFVSTLGNGKIWDVDPIAQTKSVFVSQSADGVTATSSTLFAEVNNHILGFRFSDGAQVFDSGVISGADGAAVGTGTLAGLIFVNTNFGSVVEVNINTSAQTVIASGGSRGDLVSADPNNGSLLLTQTDSVLRLTPPSGGGFGDPTTPEPASLIIWSLGGLSIAVGAWRRRKSAG